MKISRRFKAILAAAAAVLIMMSAVGAVSVLGVDLRTGDDLGNYVGYWTVGGSTERELTIYYVGNGVAEFSLRYDRIFMLEDVFAEVKGNMATFSYVYDGSSRISGLLSFSGNTVTVTITRSDHPYISTDITQYNTCRSSSSTSVIVSSGTTVGTTRTIDSLNTRLVYFIEHCDTQYFSRADLDGFDRAMYNRALNGIYARSGWSFRDTDLLNYFLQFSWYVPSVAPVDFTTDMLNEYQLANLNLLLLYKEELDAGTVEQTDSRVVYFIEHSDTEYLARADVAGFDREMVNHALNGIYARSGRKFADAELRAYFNQFSWYNPRIEPADFTADMLNQYQQANLNLILLYRDDLDAGTAYRWNDREVYFIEHCDTEYLSRSDLSGFDRETVNRVLNGIYARSGRKFVDTELREYFMQFPWYDPWIEPEDFTTDMLNQYQMANLNLVLLYRDELDAGTADRWISREVYFIEHCDTEYFTLSDLEGFDKQMTQYALNGIYARSGWSFKDADLRNYFNQFSWYVPSVAPEDFTTDMLNKYQLENLNVVLLYKEDMGF